MDGAQLGKLLDRMDDHQCELIDKMDKLISVFEAVLAEVRWSHRDDPLKVKK